MIIYLVLVAILAAWLISKMPGKKRQSVAPAVQDHDLHGSNKERAINSTPGWR